ncbi:aldolase [Bordetella sp. N]|uniref:aldolase n=1 Tax=Bordetella sp. N TaxID=1746199 RepID=UPI00070EACC2|nr:aldolase [Bordetella sp. N]ALM86116.1 class II aldolase [Bordetella sp. N]
MENTIELDKNALVQRAIAQMEKHFGDAPQWSTRQKLALLCRMVYASGHDSGMSGQITVRGTQPNTFYTQQFGIGMDEATAANLLLVDEDLNVLEGEGMANAANRFHLWIYKEKPKVNCIVHTHPFHVVALSMLGVPLEVACMDSAVLYDNCAFLPEWPGIPVGNEEGEMISAALGDKKSILLANHGQLVATHSIEEAYVLAHHIERTARLQLTAMAAGVIQKIDPGMGREARDWILTPKRTQRTFEYYARKVLEKGDGFMETDGAGA